MAVPALAAIGFLLAFTAAWHMRSVSDRADKTAENARASSLVPRAGDLANMADSKIRPLIHLAFLAEPALDCVVAVTSLRDGEQVAVASALILASAPGNLSVPADTYSLRIWKFEPGSYPAAPVPSGKPHDLTVLANAGDVIVDLRRARVDRLPFPASK
jgi:hypothetical protein